MEYLNSLSASEQENLNRYNFSLEHSVAEYPQEHHDALRQALMEAWVWLEHEGLLVPKPGTQGEWLIISRRGRQLRTGAFPISRSRAHTHRRHGHPLQTVPSAGLIERPQEKNRVDALR